MSELKSILPNQLQVGMYITKIEGGENTKKLNSEGLLTRQSTVDRIVSLDVTKIVIDTNKGIDCVGSKSYKPAASFDMSTKAVAKEDIGSSTVSFADEMKNATELHSKALSLVSDVMNDVKLGRALDLTSVDTVASEITQSLINNQNALASLMRVRSMDSYLLEHSLNVSVLMGILSRSMGFHDDVIKELVLGAFIHDVGKIRVADEILHKPGKLNGEEWAEMQRHVNYGIEAIQDVDGISQIAKDICAQHHEKLDGKGYPFGLAGDEIAQHSRMGSVVDVYDAITANRCYHKGMEPTIALKRMLTWTGDHLDKQLVYQLIRCLGVYPPGSLVELESGHVGMIQEVRSMQPNQPIVQMVYNTKKKQMLDGQVVDLRKHDNFGAIVSAVSPESYQINVDDFILSDG
jgi:HD-GYP domain-containing protein (c-di-GMP phosphodiesterase class II)